MDETIRPVPPRARFERADLMVLLTAAVIAAVAALAARMLGQPKLQAICGLVVILSVASAVAAGLIAFAVLVSRH